MNTFTIDNYPKSFASTKLNDYRFRNFLHLDNADLNRLKDEFFEFAIEYADNKEPLKEFNNYQYIDSGWEWSVFKKDDNIVVKVPANIFPEVNDEMYLKNTEETYKKILNSFPKEYIAQTVFKREDNINIMEQQFIEGQIDFTLNLETAPSEVLENFKTFLEGALKLVTEYQWLPDFWLHEQEEGLYVRNAIWEKDTNLFKVIDFAQYIDPSRLYPQLTKQVITGQIQHLKKLIAITNTKLENK